MLQPDVDVVACLSTIVTNISITGVARNFDWGGGSKWKNCVTLFGWRNVAYVTKMSS